jgi:hypothetical protein
MVDSLAIEEARKQQTGNIMHNPSAFRPPVPRIRPLAFSLPKVVA